jgi:hypothetical protein
MKKSRDIAVSENKSSNAETLSSQTQKLASYNWPARNGLSGLMSLATSTRKEACDAHNRTIERDVICGMHGLGISHIIPVSNCFFVSTHEGNMENA